MIIGTRWKSRGLSGLRAGAAMNPAEKKVLLFLVEGSTDSTSLGLVLSRLTESADVRFLVLGGDICYRYRITPENAAKTIMRSVNGFLQRYRLRKGDILKIVHVIDTDGGFHPAHARVSWRKRSCLLREGQNRNTFR